jgi:lantibiotic modifying enzyme
MAALTTSPDPRFLDAADRIAAQLCRDAIWAGAACNWLGPREVPGADGPLVAYCAGGADLYAGTSGIALFLGQIYALTGEPRYRRTATGAVRQALAYYTTIPPAERIGFYTGWPGVAWALTRLAHLCDTPAWTEAAQRIAYTLVHGLDRQGSLPMLDVIGGAAGAIAALLSLYAATGQGFLIAGALDLGDALVAGARAAGDATWPPPAGMPAAYPLTGFAHGAAGCAWALLELWRVSDVSRYRAAAAAAFAYERQWFDAQAGNWPDFRLLPAGSQPTDGPAGAGEQDTAAALPQGASGAAAAADGPPMHDQDRVRPGWPAALAWCHGAPGGALARLRAWALTGDPQHRQEAVAALHTTARALAAQRTAATATHPLCHGQAGNADELLVAADVLGEAAWRRQAAEAGHAALDAVVAAQRPWPCGVPGGGEAPGLLLGLAGIGYWLVRLATPATIPSMLLPSVAAP